MQKVNFQKTGIQRILVMKPRAIGDVLLATPVLHNLRREFPDAVIDFLVEKFAAGVLDGNHFVNNLITYDAKQNSSLSVVRKVRHGRYDLTIDLFSNPRTAILSLLSGARYRVGFPFKWRTIAYNIKVTPRGDRIHNVEFNLDALRTLGFEPAARDLNFYLSEEAGTFSDSFLSMNHLERSRFIAINIGGGWEIKRWKTARIIELCGLISTRMKLPVVILYGPSEIQEAQMIADESGAVIAPETSLHEMGAIMKNSLLLVTNDSGPMHIAAALKVPTVAIFGPTSPSLQGPFGNESEIVRNDTLDCLECNLISCPIGNICMTQLPADTVFAAVEKLQRRINHGA